jgi:hypothetical protein
MIISLAAMALERPTWLRGCGRGVASVSVCGNKQHSWFLASHSGYYRPERGLLALTGYKAALRAELV